jgi:hypothetical protein
MTLVEIKNEIEGRFPEHSILDDLENKIRLSKWVKVMFDKNSDLYNTCLAKKLMFNAIDYIEDTEELLYLSEINLRGLCKNCTKECDKRLNDKILDKAFSVMTSNDSVVA